jgi:glyoxylase-like metal-dependent hydrolase (beta-lactamase superfamily II)
MNQEGIRVMRVLLCCIGLAILVRCVVADAQPGAGGPGVGGVPTIPPEKGYFVHEIRGGLYWVTDGLYNTMFLVSSNGVIAVDPLPSLGPRYLKAIAEVTVKPVTHVIYSHEHTDHIGAASLFPKGAVYIAQQETAAILARRRDPRRPVPTVTFDTRYTLTVGDQTLVLEYQGVTTRPATSSFTLPARRSSCSST